MWTSFIAQLDPAGEGAAPLSLVSPVGASTCPLLPSRFANLSYFSQSQSDETASLLADCNPSSRTRSATSFPAMRSGVLLVLCGLLTARAALGITISTFGGMSFRLVHFLCKITCVMPLKRDQRGHFAEDPVLLGWSLFCMFLAAAESIYSCYGLLRDVVSHSTPRHGDRVGNMLSVIAKLVTLAQICAITAKLILGRRDLARLTNLLVQVRARLVNTQKFSFEVFVTCVVMTAATFATFVAYVQVQDLKNFTGWRLTAAVLEPLVRFVSCFVLSGVNLQFWGFCQVMREGYTEINKQLLGLDAGLKGKQRSRKQILASMSELRGCRSRLCDAVEQLNQLFGMCVLLALLFYNIYVHVVVYLVLTRLIDFIYDSSNEVNLNTTLVWLAIDVFFVATYFHGCITTSLEVSTKFPKFI
ncbi:Hypothetical predicted protein [Cloeon dipterum]|uniref:Gustatory receptor n=1 Tax=Cloeon dipterum TaxID=197152 RepID=A0A8S1CQ63_9INSE|nr:Hypothetical predicted protein [Cloeon dipterum]